MSKKVNIIVPVYADWASLRQNIKSLKKYYKNKYWVEAYYVNDCGPEADDLEKKIKASIRKAKNFYYRRNEKNLGFVKNCNNAAFNIVDKDSEILLLNSDTKVTKGFLEEMLRVLESESDVCAVNPRTNNAGLFGGISMSVPLDNRFYNKPKLSYKCYRKLRKVVSPTYTTLAVSGFCTLIKREFINRYGLFDEIYENGYFDDNDFSMRAHEAGFKCKIANRAYVFHDGAKSFSDEYRIERSKINQKIFVERYPSYLKIVQNYIKNLDEPVILKDTVIWRLYKKLSSAIEYGHDNGCLMMFSKTGQYIANKLKKDQDVSDPNIYTPKLKIWTHELSNTGAPLVLLDILQQWDIKNSLSVGIELYYPKQAARSENLYRKLQAMGIILVENDFLDSRFRDGDVVILNSSAYGGYLFDDLLTNLENGTVRHLFWYIHEDSEKISDAFRSQGNVAALSWYEMVVAERYSRVRQRILDVINKGKMTIYVPSSQTMLNWQKYLGTKCGFHIMPGRIFIDDGDFTIRSKTNFDKIDFSIVGSSPMKGQLSVVQAMISFYHEYFQKNPNRYRDFSLNIIGIEDESIDWRIGFLRNAAKGLEQVKIYKKRSHNEVHKLLKKFNFTILYSITEAFSMATMEGMAFGHPIIRNESSGQKEQLKPGVNGWAVDTKDWWGLVQTIEEILNKEKTSNEKLAKMSAESVKIARENRRQKYRLIDDVNKILITQK
jgi:GT2 family glycosyltransferase/glycosyltransferase involved in cell wall biosynthesis